MNILFPGRHHLLTQFQFDYLAQIESEGLKKSVDVKGKPMNVDEPLTAILFAVTSSNLSNTRRNPLPLHLRAMALHEFSSGLKTPTYIFDVDDVGHVADFAAYTVKRIHSRSNGQFALTPKNTVVLCSTPAVIDLYEALGFKILPAELTDRKKPAFSTRLPWDLVESLAASQDWKTDPALTREAHPATRKVWRLYNLGELVQTLFRDRLIGDEGDITETRDYNSYVRQMDNIAELKFNEVRLHIRPGRVGDIGCAVGSWIRLACADDRLRESDFYGIEVSRQLYDICEQRKNNKEFANPNVFFSKKNAVDHLVFQPNSMNAIHTSSLTHEIWSYVSDADVQAARKADGAVDAAKAHEALGFRQLRKFIQNRYAELTHGGVWVNRDVIGPENGAEIVYMWLDHDDGANLNVGMRDLDREAMKDYVDGLSTRGRFFRFARDFRKKEGYKLAFESVNIRGKEYIKLALKDACDFLLKKDYTDNWLSEMHEMFTFWSFPDWVKELKEAGFHVLPESRAFRNEWIYEKRIQHKAKLFRHSGKGLEEIQFPVTTAVIVAEKR